MDYDLENVKYRVKSRLLRDGDICYFIERLFRERDWDWETCNGPFSDKHIAVEYMKKCIERREDLKQYSIDKLKFRPEIINEEDL